MLLGARVDLHRDVEASQNASAQRRWLDVGKVDVSNMVTGPSSQNGWDGVLGVTGLEVAGMPSPTVRVASTQSAAADWARSGAMALSGSSEDDDLLVAPGSLATAMRGAAAAFELLAACWGVACPLDGPALLGERAALQAAGAARERVGLGVLSHARRVRRVAGSQPRPPERPGYSCRHGSKRGLSDGRTWGRSWHVTRWGGSSSVPSCSESPSLRWDHRPAARTSSSRHAVNRGRPHRG